jgi:serine/threonine protein kinase/Tol biopolymer transport system component
VALDPGTRLGPYEILTPLGTGGMGEVYRARDTRLDREIAIKVLPAGAVSAQALERFEREAKAIAALNHPGICAIYDIGTSPVPFLVMELLEGETLHQRLTRGRLEVPALIEIGLALADALAAAHARGVVHRDLKPANIVLTPRGPKILDFGLARITETEAHADVNVTASSTLSGQAPLTGAGVTIGTLGYMSPEQLRGDTLDARTDLFSLGLVLYETATGKRAFSGTTSAVTSAAILHEQPTPPRELQPDLPVRLERAILTLLEKDRDVRTQTASELRAELMRLKRELTESRVQDTLSRTMPVATSHTSSAPVSTAPAPPSSSDAQLVAGIMRRHRGALAGVAALIALAIAGGAYFTSSRESPTDAAARAASLSLADLQVETLTTSGTANLPAISPDGNYVVYVENGDGRSSLRVRQVATGSNVEIVPAEAGVSILGATVTPDGAFVNYVRQALQQRPELWQIPFLGGSPRRLLPGVAGRVGFSPDGRQMAFVRVAPPDRTELVVAPSDGSSERVLATRQRPEGFLTTAVAQSFAPAWSPDGATIASLGARAGERTTGQVVFVDTKTGAERTVDFGPALPGTGLTWIDEYTVLLSAVERSSAPIQLWLMSYPGGGLRRFTNDTNQYVSPSLTADRGSLVVARNEASFSVWTSDAAADRWTQTVAMTPAKGPIGFRLRWIGDDLVYPATAAGGFALTRWRMATKTTEILARSAGNQSVSADGSRMVYFDYDTGELWKADGTKRDRLPSSNFFAASSARLSPDGRLLALLDPAAPGGLALRVMSADDPSSVREITAAGVRPGGAEISPDGRSIAFSSFDAQNRPAITVCDLDACTARTTFPAPGTSEVHWTPDGKSLAYVDPGTQSDLWAQPIDGSAPRQLTHFPADGQQIWDFAWSADGKRLAVARARIASDIVLFRGLKKQ